MARKLVRDYGYEKAQIQTRPQFRVKRHPHDRAKYPVDIAVFSTTPRSDESLRIVVECKRKNEDLDHSEDQLRSYLAFSKATFGVLYNGDEFRCFKKTIDRKQVEIVSAPDIPRAGEPVDHAESIRYGALLPPNDLVMEFQHIRNRIAGSGIGSISTEGTARNIINLLFCKMMDEKNARSQNTVMEFRFDEQESSQRVAERVQRLFTKVPGHYGDVVPAEEAISLDEETISAIVAVLQKYKLLGSRRDVVGNAFEVFIGPALAGDEGQFFTPRTVVDTMVRMAGVGPDERVLDPACGSGGFLTVCMKRMFEAISDKTFSAEAQEEERRRVAQHSLFGVDKNQFLARVAKAYMAILGDGSTNILCDDSLLPRAKWGAKTQGAVEFGIFDVVLTNPPFGKNLQVDKRVSAQYELGSARSNVPPQILFLERCLEFLREDGRLGIVLPEGIFGNPQHQHVREWLMRHADIVALVSLPAAAFKISGKQGTSTRTQFAILRKRARGKQNEPIFMAIATKVGHDSRGQEIPRNDLPDIAKRFEDFEARGSLAVEGRLGYLVRPEALESDLSLVCRRYDPDIGRRLEELRVSGYELKTFGELEKELVISIRGGGGGGRKKGRLLGRRRGERGGGPVHSNLRHRQFGDRCGRSGANPQDAIRRAEAKWPGSPSGRHPVREGRRTPDWPLCHGARGGPAVRSAEPLLSNPVRETGRSGPVPVAGSLVSGDDESPDSHEGCGAVHLGDGGRTAGGRRPCHTEGRVAPQRGGGGNAEEGGGSEDASRHDRARDGGFS